jgi:hypothetical protein
MRFRMRRPSRRRTPTGTPARAIRNAKIRKPPTGTPRPSVTIRDPKTKSKPTGTPRPKRTISQAMKDASNVLTEIPAPKPRLKRKPIGIPVATPAPKRKPTGTPRPTRGIRGATQAQLRQIRQRQQRKPTGRQPTAAEKTMLEEFFKKQRSLRKPPTSEQIAAMRKQAIAKYGNAAQRRRRRDEFERRSVRQGRLTPGQIRSRKMAEQKRALGRSMPKRRARRTSRRLI